MVGMWEPLTEDKGSKFRHSEFRGKCAFCVIKQKFVQVYVIYVSYRIFVNVAKRCLF